MKKILIGLAAICFVACNHRHSAPWHLTFHGHHPRPIERKLLEQATDERGLTSVVYIENGDTVGLDYTTPHEFDSLFHKQPY